MSVSSVLSPAVFPLQRQITNDVKIENLELTNEEIALKSLRSQISDISGDDLLLENDFYLLRWLKTTGFNVDKAAKRIRDTSKWKQENKVAMLGTQEFDPELMKEFPMFLDSWTREGVPRNYISVEDAEVLSGKVFTIGKNGKQRFVQHMIQVLAKLEKHVLDHNLRVYDAQCKKEGRRIPITLEGLVQSVAIVDGERFGLKMISSPTVSTFFESVLKLLKPILSMTGITVKAFNGNEASWKPVLLDLVHEDELWKEWGGNKTH